MVSYVRHITCLIIIHVFILYLQIFLHCVSLMISLSSFYTSLKIYLLFNLYYKAFIEDIAWLHSLIVFGRGGAWGLFKHQLMFARFFGGWLFELVWCFHQSLLIISNKFNSSPNIGNHMIRLSYKTVSFSNRIYFAGF